MDESKKIVRTAMIVLFVLAVAVAVYYFFIAGKGKSAGTPESALQPKNVAGEEAAGKAAAGATAIAADLDKSDDPVRTTASDLSSNALFTQWLKSKDLVRKFVAAVDNIANGQSPRAQVDFFSPAGPFKVAVKNGQTFVDPATYDRYNVIADVLDSVSTAGCARVYASARPLLAQAYRELGYPTQDFHQTLLRAVNEILRTPVVDEPIGLEKKVTTYAMLNETLEELSPAQKHILRMGPENLQLIQAKLREIALALGFSDVQLSRPKTIKK
jgi:hypothetical protein